MSSGRSHIKIPPPSAQMQGPFAYLSLAMWSMRANVWHPWIYSLLASKRAGARPAVGRTRTREMVRKANAEATFEKRPRKQAEVAQHRELLPTKEADGSLKRKRVQLTKKEIAKQRKAESGNDKGKKKKSEKKAEKLAAASSSKKTSEAALHKMAAQVETSAMTLDEKKVAVARLSQRLLEAPHKNVKLLRQLHDLATRDPSAVVQRLALLSEVAVLRDVLPSYRIRLPTEKELQMQVSSDVAELRDYEKVLLRSYEDCLASLGKWLRGSPAQRVAAVRGLCALLTKGRDFNAIHKIIEMLVPVCNWKEEALRDAACGAMAELFVEDGQGEATLLAVRGMAELFKNSSFNVHPAMLEAWLELKLDAAPNTDEGVNSNTPSSKNAKKRKRNLDPVTKELAAAAGERGNKGLMHGRVLEQIFVSYARVIKKCPASPLMPLVLRGIAKFAHQVNVSLLLDVLSNLRAMLRSDSGTPMATLTPTLALNLALTRTLTLILTPNPNPNPKPSPNPDPKPNPSQARAWPRTLPSTACTPRCACSRGTARR